MTRRKSYQKGSVSLHNGQWSVRYREYDHRSRKWRWKREKLGKHKGVKDAEKAAAPIIARVNERNNLESAQAIYEEVTFEQFVRTHWRAYEISARHQQSTIDTRGSVLKTHLLPFFGKMILKEITPSVVSDFMNERRGKGYSGNTLTSLYGVLNLMLEIARQYDLIPQNPVRRLVHKPEFQRVEKATLTPEQIRAITDSLKPRDRLYITLLAVTGIRMGEGLGLRWLNFDQEKGELSITNSLYRNTLKQTKTKGSRGRFRLHPVIVNMLSEHRKQTRFPLDSDYIFARPDGRPVGRSALRRRLYNAMDKAGIARRPYQHGFHVFRHTAATLLFDRLGDMRLVQAVMRHATIATTNLYVHSDRSVALEGVDLLTEAIFADPEASGAPTVPTSSRLVS
jgi:integrase